ncbi:hypothetical protein [Marivita sp. XM-24bin2]|uniref:hypothetical protein n=1 Tax=Marivita sp. XM-24bin2 TaxID=2133951 RepID=UPI0025BD05B4|nr:hypothetical protein [Marivita sp. XM-24bin2]MCR9111234.1 hypothetical protein [Paracoccaceae bacterium]
MERAYLDGRIDSFLIKRLSPSLNSFKVQSGVPTPTWNRFDLGFKLLYLDGLRSTESEFARRIYSNHIKAFSLGDMSEPGNPKKLGVDRFLADFAEIFDNLRHSGFDTDISLLPLAHDGTPINGGHRTACAISLGIPITSVQTGLEPVQFDYRFFKKRGVVLNDLDAAALRLVSATPHAAVALLWPAARARDREVDVLIGPAIYRRKIPLSLKAGHNLLTRVYANEPWLGDPEQNHPGVRRKLMECFSGRDDLRLIVFDAPPNVDRVALKERIRRIYGIGKSSVHITDTHAEAVEITQMLLNENSRHFLEHARPNQFSATRAKISQFKTYLRENEIPSHSVAVDTGLVMGAYGLRPPNDIDVVSDRPLPAGPVEQHDGRYRSVELPELLQDPAHHLFFRKVKFISLENVAALKSKRLAGQDREDVILIQRLIRPQTERILQNNLYMRLQFAHLRFRRRIIKIIYALGAGPTVKRLYHMATRR